ncbi:MAG: hypothetical protein Q4D94_04235 [Bacillota bacterium]|nr:hypothetical protein [Bacillota bacterium]
MMNLKYYLRGLGIGIVVTALIMSIAAGGKKETLSDEEIKARAKALGMTEESTLLEASLTSDEASGDETSLNTDEELGDSEDEVSAENEQPDDPEADETVEAEATPMPEEAASNAEDETSEQAAKQEEIVIIQVKSGEGSYTVCQRLQEAGLIASASEFDTFLYERGYDKKIHAGTLEIPADADPEQIARILSGLE